jgi:hypothetical protein
MHLVATHETPCSESKTAPAGVAVGCTAQRAPFPRSANVRCTPDGITGRLPTIVQFLRTLQATSLRFPKAAAGSAAQRAPFQRSTNERGPQSSHGRVSVPITVHALAELHDSAPKLKIAYDGNGLTSNRATTDHLVPFQRSETAPVAP